MFIGMLLIELNKPGAIPVHSETTWVNVFANKPKRSALTTALVVHISTTFCDLSNSLRNRWADLKTTYHTLMHLQNKLN